MAAAPRPGDAAERLREAGGAGSAPGEAADGPCEPCLALAHLFEHVNGGVLRGLELARRLYCLRRAAAGAR